MKSFSRPDYEFVFSKDKPGKIGVLKDGLTVWFDEAKLTELISELQSDMRFYEEVLESLSLDRFNKAWMDGTCE